MPSLRERKRYLAFEIISEAPIEEFNEFSEAFWTKSLEFLGELGCADAGFILIHEKYNKGLQRGVIRVNNKHLNKLRATLALIENIDNKKSIVRSIAVSGMLNKAAQKLTAA